MNDKLEAIKEAITFIRENWIGKKGSYWEGVPYEFVGATVFAGVTAADVKHVIKALQSGEHVDISGLSGEFAGKTLTKIRVSK